MHKVNALLPYLECELCGGNLTHRNHDPANNQLECSSCRRRVPVAEEIPRFVREPDDALARRTQASFGYEWSHFDDWTASGSTNFRDYFCGLDLSSLADAVVLDAGCGMGRHARQLAAHVRHIVAIDFSRAVDRAARNVSDQPNVSCIQADLTRLPLREGVFDFVYSMGVVHHLSNTEEVVQSLARKLRPGGRLRVYLYWKRTGVSGALLRVVTAARHVTTRLPFPMLRALCWALSVGLYGTVIVPYRALLAMGFTAPKGWPLYVYTKYPFQVLYNDQFDRFSAPLEKRYSAEEAATLLRNAGLSHVRVFPMYGWIAEGTR